MKIAINNTCIFSPLTGIGHFTLQVQMALLTKENINLMSYKSIDEFLKKSEKTDTNIASIAPPNYNNSPIKQFKKFLAKFRIFQRIYLKKEFYKYGQRCKRFGTDIYLEPNYFIFWSYKPVVPIIYDLSIIRHPETHTNELVKIFRKKLKKSIYKSNAIITISEFSKNEILDVFKINPEKIFVAPCGASTNFKPRTNIEVKETLDSLGLNYRQFILVVGTFEPRKNLKNICLAYSLLPQELRNKYPLVLCGAKGWGDINLPQNIIDLISKNEIRILDYVSDTMLHELTSSARVSCYISIYEGFGLPVLEAMQSGTPIITSNVSSMPEVAGDAGLLVDPLDTQDILTAISSVLTNDSQMHTMIEKGLEQAKKFSWDRCANSIIDACEYASKH